MTRSAWVIGVGMTPFQTPRNSRSYVQLASEAIREALGDAQLPYDAVEQAYAGYVYGDSCSGHRAAYEVGLSGVPIFNLNSNCSSGGSALFMARQAVSSGAVEVALAFGFEQMVPGALSEHWADRPSPLDAFTRVADASGDAHAPLAPRLFGAAAREYAARHGIGPETLAAVSVKSRRHAAANPKAVFREPLTIEQVLASPAVCGPLTRLQCCPPTCGAAAAVVASDEVVRRLAGRRAVMIAGQALVTDLPATFGDGAIAVVGYPIAREAARQAFEQAGVDPADVEVAEVHDCFTINELLAYESLGLCAEGGARSFIEDGQNTYGGRCVTNPSGGLLSKGHPLGATGLAQCAELVTQLRGEAGSRQVEGARAAAAHNIGIGSSCVVTVYLKST